MELKVCGVRSLAMVQVCQDLLVNYIGLNFVPTSKRVVGLTLAHKISHAFTGKKVGVFRNQPVTEILKVLSVVDLNIIQLHGDESPIFINDLRAKLPQNLASIGIWKAFRIDENFDVKVLQQYSKNCDLFLFDGKKPGSGTAVLAKNRLLEATQMAQKLGVGYGLAGGVNTKTAPELMQKFPDVQLLDTASGVEKNAVFNQEKLTQIVKLLRDA